MELGTEATLLNERSALQLLRIIFWVFILSLAFFEAYSGRFQPFSADSIVYLDMADYFRHFQFDKAVSSYWSPAYPLVIAFFLELVKPRLLDEFAVMKIADLFILICTGVMFELFLKEMFLLYRQGLNGKPNQLRISKFLFNLNCYVVFAWSMLTLGGAHEDTPDYLLTFFILAATFITIRIQRIQKANWKTFAMLGAVLGSAFMTKSFVSVLIPIFLLSACYSIRKSKNVATMVLAFAVALAVVSLPYSIELSSKGRTSTILSATKLNYLWTILLDSTIMNDSSPRYAHLTHPLKIIFKTPKVYYYREPIDGTYPLWYDVGYWGDGIDVKIDPMESAVCFLADWCYFFMYFLYVPVYFWAVVALISATPALSMRALVRMRVPIMVSLVALFSYSVVVNVIKEQPQTQRYFPCFVLFLFMSILASIKLRRSARSIAAVIASTLITITLCGIALKREVRLIGYDARAQTNWRQQLSMGLGNAGLHPGDQVAMLANLDTELSYFKLAGLRVVATIAEPCRYWLVAPEVRRQMIETLRQRGVKAIIFHTIDPNPSSPEYWQAMNGKQLVADKVTGRYTLADKPMPRLKYFDPADGWARIPNSGCYYLKLF